ncbi:MAG: hypothetical protein J6A89_06010 [Clostridia bacterium]|nr:hypothetical protein [Clostridia bacterium]
MNFEKLKEKINNLNCESTEELKNFEENIDITLDDFNNLVEDIFSDKIEELDLNKIPYVIDELYQSNDQIKFMLCCILIEATCFDLPFITNLEDYPLFKEKYETLKNTLVTVYEAVDNCVANCMALIILNNDPTFELLDQEQKEILINATNRKLQDIINYLKNSENIDNTVYQDLELIIDLASYMNDRKINKQIEELSSLPLDFSCSLFIAKYKLINNISIKSEEIEKLIQDKKEIDRVVSVFEKNGGNNLLAKMEIKQEEIAKSAMINWLEYPTELGEEPDDIELLGTLDLNGEIVYIYKFKSHIFDDKGYMIGISGGYERDKITSMTTGLTFSKFETLENDFMKQGKELVEFINEYWKRVASEQ